MVVALNEGGNLLGVNPDLAAYVSRPSGATGASDQLDFVEGQSTN